MIKGIWLKGTEGEGKGKGSKVGFGLKDGESLEGLGIWERMWGEKGSGDRDKNIMNILV